MIIEYEGKHPRIGQNVFIAPTAVIIGDVEIGDGASVWYGAVLRGDEDGSSSGADRTFRTTRLFTPRLKSPRFSKKT